jgi:hypothetical protein
MDHRYIRAKPKAFIFQALETFYRVCLLEQSPPPGGVLQLIFQELVHSFRRKHLSITTINHDTAT